MKALAVLLTTLSVLFVVTTLVLWAWAPWLHGVNSARLFGTGFVVLLAAAAAGAFAAVAWIRS